MRAESPLGDVRVVASLMPQKLEVEKTNVRLSDAELEEIIRAGVADRADRSCRDDDAESVGRGDGEAVH